MKQNFAIALIILFCVYVVVIAGLSFYTGDGRDLAKHAAILLSIGSLLVGLVGFSWIISSEADAARRAAEDAANETNREVQRIRANLQTTKNNVAQFRRREQGFVDPRFAGVMLTCGVALLVVWALRLWKGNPSIGEMLVTLALGVWLTGMGVVMYMAYGAQLAFFGG